MPGQDGFQVPGGREGGGVAERRKEVMWAGEERRDGSMINK
jgi:hypothetical protein